MAAAAAMTHGSTEATLLLRRALAEFIGTALLWIAVIGSGIAAQSLSRGDTGLERLENAVATGASLVAIILALGPVWGAHLNPVVSAADALFGGLRWRELAAYVVPQLIGAAVACGAVRFLWPRLADSARRAIVPHEQEVGVG